MHRYRNRSGNSGIAAYRLDEGWIEIQFVDGDIYRYDVGSAGKRCLDTMQALAKQGRGLAAYVSRYVRDRYRSKASPPPRPAGMRGGDRHVDRVGRPH